VIQSRPIDTQIRNIIQGLMSEPGVSLQTEHRKEVRIQPGLFTLLLLLLVGGAIVRSAIATRLDGFTMDEPYHITAGVSYVRYADFRINPEHPPLVKLWVGSFISATGFRLTSIRPFADKLDERDFAEQDVYLNNDCDSVQRRARIAMWTLNGLLLIVLAFAVRRTFGPGVALGMLLFLAIDPTVAAHLPVVMTDLPVSLLSAAALVLSIRAFRDWAWTDLVCCSAILGLALGTKHSAPIFFIVVLLIGAVCALVEQVSRPGSSRSFRFTKLLAVVLGALTVLWGLYFFRFTESRAGSEVFNRPLADKIADVRAPVYRFVLKEIAATHVVPRAYTWGFADTISAGLEGRATPVTAFGHSYWKTGPKYFFPGVIALKLPIGLGVLVLTGFYLFFARRLPREWNLAVSIVLAALLTFLLVLASGSSYAGIRHALPAVVLLAIIAGFAVHLGLVWNSKALGAIVTVALLAAAASALPVARPWEYFNEIIGGAKNGFLYFNDEGVDLGQRGKELAAYYHRVLEPAGEKPLLAYLINQHERKARGLAWPEQNRGPDQPQPGAPNFSGTVMIDARFLSKQPFWDNAYLRGTTPTARLGNLLVFRGPCKCGSLLASGLFFGALGMIYAEKPDLEAAAQMLKQAIALDPTPFFVHLQLGNVYLRRGLREDALRAYSDASRYASYDLEQKHLIDERIKRVSSEPLSQIPDLRNPTME
jgi:tetratricopeptide (TPR) repeat protein